MTAPLEPTSRTGATLTALKASIPAEKWPAKLKRTGIGAVFIATGCLLTAKADAPWWVAAIGVGLGTHTWAGEVVNKTLKSLPKLIASAIADILGAILKAKQGTPPDGTP